MAPTLSQQRQKDGHPTVLFVETEIGWATRPVDCIHKSITSLQTRRRTSENACRRLQTLDLFCSSGRRDQPPSRATGLQTLHSYCDVMEGRHDRLKRLDPRRSIDYLRQGLQHFWVGVGVVIVCIVLVLPQTDTNRILAAGI